MKATPVATWIRRPRVPARAQRCFEDTRFGDTTSIRPQVNQARAPYISPIRVSSPQLTAPTVKPIGSMHQKINRISVARARLNGGSDVRWCRNGARCRDAGGERDRRLAFIRSGRHSADTLLLVTPSRAQSSAPTSYPDGRRGNGGADSETLETNWGNCRTNCAAAPVQFGPVRRAKKSPRLDRRWQRVPLVAWRCSVARYIILGWSV
jgi:hypothetical protein